MPDQKKIINLDAARRKQRGERPPMYELLAWIDELEETLETLNKAGVTSRDQLEALIHELEAQTSTDADE